MVVFEHPFVLLFIPFLLLLLRGKNKMQKMETLFPAKTLEQITLYPNLRKTPLLHTLFLISMLLMLVALARPIIPDSKAQNRLNRSFVIALDLSSSIHKNDIYPTRFSFIEKKVKALVKMPYSFKISLLVYARYAYKATPMSHSLEFLNLVVQSITSTHKFAKEANLFSAIEGASIILKKEKVKNIFLFSDNENIVDIREEKAFLIKNKLHLYVLNVNKKSSPALLELAKASDGAYSDYTYSNKDISSLIKQMEVSKQVDITKSKQSEEIFIYPLFLSLVILFYIYSLGLVFKHKSMFPFLLVLVVFLVPKTNASVLDWYTFIQAQNNYKTEHYKKSLKLYEEISPTKEVYYNRGNVHYKLENYAKAIQNYQKALGEKKSLNAKIYHNLGNSYLQLKSPYLAKNFYEKSLQLCTDIQTVQNLEQVKQIIKNLKRKKSKLKGQKYKLPKNMSMYKKQIDNTLYSDYRVKLSNLVLTQEQTFIEKAKNRRPLIYLQKLPTKKVSKNVY